jgi:lipoate-protein ligase A
MPLMKILDLTFSSPADNLACDEALLDESELADGGEILRFWEPRNYFVVLGYSNAWKKEVLPKMQKSKKIPILRRVSGGGAVLQGPGCLNYSLILKIRENGAFRNIRATNEYVMERHRTALQTLTGKKVTVQGHTDLTIQALKFSGNSQRRKRKRLLFHGTFLLTFNLSHLEDSLTIPEKQPVYRQNRSHASFVTNLEIPAGSVKKTLRKIWDAKSELEIVPHDRIKQLSKERYSKKEWNLKF